MKIYAERDNVNDDEVIVSKIYFKNSAKVKAGDLVLDLETSKTAINIECPIDGFLKLAVKEGDEIPVGEYLFEIVSSIEDSRPKSDSTVSKKDNENHNNEKYIFTKDAKEKINELGISEYKFEKKLVSLEDVINFANKVNNDDSNENKITNNSAKIDVKQDSKVEAHNNLPVEYLTKKHSLRKRAEIKNLSSNGNQSTQSVIGISINVLDKRTYECPYLFRDSIADLVVYESSRLLTKYPQLNSLYLNEKEYGEYAEINVGFSFDNTGNLKVLSIREADKISIEGVQSKIQELLELFESNKPIEESLLNTATITISDLSTTGVSFMLPLVSSNQSSIIGIIKNSTGSFQLFVGFDHKVTEGLYVSKFLAELKENIESHFFGGDLLTFLKCDKCDLSSKEAKLLGNIGFIKMVGLDGKEKNICENCFHGY